MAKKVYLEEKFKEVFLTGFGFGVIVILGFSLFLPQSLFLFWWSMEGFSWRFLTGLVGICCTCLATAGGILIYLRERHLEIATKILNTTLGGGLISALVFNSVILLLYFMSSSEVLLIQGISVVFGALLFPLLFFAMWLAGFSLIVAFPLSFAGISHNLTVSRRTLIVLVVVAFLLAWLLGGVVTYFQGDTGSLGFGYAILGIEFAAAFLGARQAMRSRSL